MTATSDFDVFLSHNSRDKPQVEQIANRLVSEAKLQPFLDKWHLVPGDEWQPELANALERSATVAVFFGPSGNGPWHHEEMQVALMRAVREKKEFRVIPVVLPQADANSIPAFLQLRTWVDFSAGINNEIAFKRLVAGIRGQATEFEGIELPDEPAPYRGLMHFEAEHARFFFGREQDIGPTQGGRGLIDRLRVNRFVAVVGSSGSGKSSLVRAGLLPRLARDAIPGSSHWRVVPFTPADDPFRSLANALVSGLTPSERGRTVTDLLVQFDEPETGLRHTLETWFAETSEPLLLFVDQFEELFTHAPSSRSNAAAREKYDERVGRFVSQLAREAMRPDGRFRVVITVRADFMPHCLRLPELKNLLQDRQLLLGELARDEAALREVIQRPAQEVGAMLETGLMDVLLADVRGRTGVLPLLEHALSELWARDNRRGPWLTLEAYHKTGGVSGALEQRAEDTLQRLSPPQQQIARRIFVKLTSLEDGTEDTRRRFDRKSLYAETADSAEIDAAINVLAGPEARLIVADGDSLSIAHETLIQNWPRLQTWLSEDRQLERIHRELERAANDWEAYAHGKPYLFHGDSAKLAETEEHATALDDRMTGLEREFLTACRQEREFERAEKERRLQRELKLAQEREAEAQGRAEDARAAAERQKRLTWSALGAAAVAVCLFVAAAWQYKVAEGARQAAATAAGKEQEARIAAEDAQQYTENALVASFFRTIGVSDGESSPIEERASLWDLAELDGTAVREQLLDCWFRSSDSLRQANCRNGLGLRAAGELNPDIRHRLMTDAEELALDLATALEKQSEAEQLDRLGYALAVPAALLESAQVAPIFVRGANSLADAMEKATEVGRLSTLGSLLAELAARLEPAQAAPMVIRGASRLAEAMENETFAGEMRDALVALTDRLEPAQAAPILVRGANALADAMKKESGIRRLTDLSPVLAELGARLEPAEGGPVLAEAAKRLADVMEKESDAVSLSHLAEALAALTARLEPGQAASIVLRGANRLSEAMDKETSAGPLGLLGDAQALLVGRLEPAQAAPIVVRGANRLAEAMVKETEADRLSRLAEALMAWAPRLEAAQAALIADRLSEVIEKEKDSARLSDLCHALTALAARLEAAQAALIADRLSEVIEKEKDSARLSDLGHALTALAARLKSDQATSFVIRCANRLAEAMEKEASVNRFRMVRDSLAALAARLESAQVAPIANRLVEAMEREADADRLFLLDRALAELAPRLEPAQAAPIAKRLAEKMERETDADRLDVLRCSVKTLGARLQPDQAASILFQGVSRLAEVMENETDIDRFTMLRHSLVVLATGLDGAQAAQVAVRLAEAMKKETDVDRLRILDDAIASLAVRLEGAQAAQIAVRLAEAMKKETDVDRLSHLGYAIATLAARLDPTQVGPIVVASANRVAEALENEADSDALIILQMTIQKLVARLEPAQAAPIVVRCANRLAEAMQCETAISRLDCVGSALGDLTAGLEPAQAAPFIGRSGNRLADAMEKEADVDRLHFPGFTLAKLIARLEPPESARIANRGANRLAEAMEKETDVHRLTRLCEALTALSARLESSQGARIAGRLAEAMERETDFHRLCRLCDTLAALVEQLDSTAHQTPLFALSYLLLRPIPAPPDEGQEGAELRRRFAALCQPLNLDELVGVLKWPFCVGEAEKIVLAELEEKLSKDREVQKKFKRPISFGGDLGKFIEQAESLGITNHKTPAHRPRLEEVQKELAALRQVPAAKP